MMCFAVCSCGVEVMFSEKSRIVIQGCFSFIQESQRVVAGLLVFGPTEPLTRILSATPTPFLGFALP